MKRLCLFLLIIALAGGLRAQENILSPVVESPSLFVDVPARLHIPVTGEVQLPEDLPADTPSLAFVQWELSEKPGAGKSQAVILTFIPRKPGLLTLPPLSLEVNGATVQTVARQIQVGAPQRSREMTLEIRPATTSVRVGQPLRLDVTWDCKLRASQLKQLNWSPQFFFDPEIETDIPRPVVPQEKQLGLPIGGRRVLAEWDKPTEPAVALGRVTFPIFVRFKTSGTHEIPASRLSVVQLTAGESNFAPYASYFNNSLFEPVDRTLAHNRLYVESAPFKVEVTDLPPVPADKSFTGWVTPCRVEAAIQPNEGDVGQLMELSLRVFSDAPERFLTPPALTRQDALQHRFWVDKDVRRVWHPDGAEFLVRFRPLTTSLRAFPALEFLVFNPATGQYEEVRTRSLRMKVREQNGQTAFNRRSLLEESGPPADNPEGIWHNDPADPMSDLLNMIVNALAEGFAYWLALAGLLAVLLRPLVLERRRRALDPAYRHRVDAYRAFRKCRDQSPEQMKAFREWMAALGGVKASALTVRDIEAIMIDHRLPTDDIRVARELFEAGDAASFDRCKSPATHPPLGDLAERIARVANRASILVIAMLLLATTAHADDWSEAEMAFQKALQCEAGSPEGSARFSESALKFEAAARAKVRPGRAWYNAGNAWMEAGQLGRAIAAYRQARIYRPFDDRANESLSTARALRVDQIPSPPLGRLLWPSRWLEAGLVILAFALAAGWLLHLRYRTRWALAVLWIPGVLAVASLALLIRARHFSDREGVVIVNEVQPRKGPGYHYAPAFSAPLHNGVECILREQRGDWFLVSLSDGRNCWLPADQVSWIRL